MMWSRRGLQPAAVAIALAIAAPAAAQPSSQPAASAYPVTARAPTSAADPRAEALDDAFAEATRLALADAVPSAIRSARRADLDREIIARARLWVASFKVTRDREVDGQRVLEVNVRIDLDKLHARLRALEIEPVSAAPTEPAAPGRATLLLRVTVGEAARATFGRRAERQVWGAAAVTSTLGAAGIALLEAPASGAAPKPGDGVPVDDDSARGFAGDVKADLAVVAGVTVAPTGPVRAHADVATYADADVRLVRASDGALLGEARARGFGVGVDAAAAGERAATRALWAATTRAVPASLRTGRGVAPVVDGPAAIAPASVAPTGYVVVRVQGPDWAVVRALRAGAPTLAVLAVARGWIEVAWPAADTSAAQRQIKTALTTAVVEASVRVRGGSLEIK